MKTVIINADDFGLTEGVTKGIAESILLGVVSRTSAMMCTGGKDLILQYASGLDGKIGLHLQLTDGIPLAPVESIPSLVTTRSNFPDYKSELKLLNPEEIELEWELQIQAILELGITPSHIDTHHNIHGIPMVFKVYRRLALKYDFLVRPLTVMMANNLKSSGLRTTDLCLESWQGEDITESTLLSHTNLAFETIDNNGTLEVMVHPGYVDQNLTSRSHYLYPREKELAILCNPALPEMFTQSGIKLS